MTKLLYLDHSELYEVSANKIEDGNDEKGRYFIFDQTIFYPQGGGQPADKGQVIVDNNILNIYDVRNVNGEIRHYTHDQESIRSQNTKMMIDKDRRKINTQYHTAVHLVAAVVENLLSIIAIKGHQFPYEAYIEFEGIADGNIQKIQLAIDDQINHNKSVSIRNLDYSQAEELAKTLPYTFPINENLRVCDIESFKPVPCGGTHVKFLNEIGKMIIGKIKAKKDKTKIFYEIEKYNKSL